MRGFTPLQVFVLVWVTIKDGLGRLVLALPRDQAHMILMTGHCPLICIFLSLVGSVPILHKHTHLLGTTVGARTG